jgi:hypothetical protein
MARYSCIPRPHPRHAVKKAAERLQFRHMSWGALRHDPMLWDIIRYRSFGPFAVLSTCYALPGKAFGWPRRPGDDWADTRSAGKAPLRRSEPTPVRGTGGTGLDLASEMGTLGPMKSDPSTRLEVEKLRGRLGRYQKGWVILFWMLIFEFLVPYVFPIEQWLPFDIGYGYLTLAVVIPFALVVVAVAFVYPVNFNRCWLACPHCGSETALLHKWVCGYCDRYHFWWTSWKHSFVETCARKECAAAPHSLICFSCRQPIVWNDAGFKNSPEKSAWLPDSPPPSEIRQKPEPFEERRKRLEIE